MKEFFLKILEGFLKALSDIIDELIGYDKRKYKKKEPPPSPPPATPPPAQPDQQVEKPPVNTLVPVAEPPLYKRSSSVLTYQERKFLGAIRRAVKDEYIILMKVRMGDFIYITNQPKDGTFFPNQVMFKHADFLLCGKMRIEPLLVIELDDSSHRLPQKMESDKIKNETCDAVGLPYLRIELQKQYDVNLLRKQIKGKVLKEAPLFENDTD